MTNRRGYWLLVLLGALICGCGSPPDYIALNSESQTAFRQAEQLFEQDKVEEGVRLLLPVAKLHPEDDRVKALLEKLTPEQQEALLESTLLGFNKGKRAPVDSSVLARVFFYLPDRIFDMLDVFGFEINFGPQAGAGFWMTRAMQAEAFLGTTAGIGIYQKRNIGGRTEALVELTLGPAGGTALAGARGGTGGADSTATALVLHFPTAELYQEYRDYWALGAKVGAGFLGFEFEFHMVELVDFFGGWFLWDPLNDDLATTRMLRFNENQQDTYEKLIKLIGKLEPEDLKAYQEKYPEVFPERGEK